jgi:hypothetical protein
MICQYILPMKVIRTPFVLGMPQGAKILRVGLQYHAPYIWADVDPTMPKSECQYEWLVTGEEPRIDYIYVDTILLEEGAFVYHLYRDTKNW